MEPRYGLYTEDPREVTPLHEVRDREKYKLLVAAMTEHGWQGHPVLAYDDGNGYHAITGSHRIAAARAAGIQISVYFLDAERVERYCIDHDLTFSEALGADDDDRLDFIRQMGDAEALAIMEAECC